MPTSRHRGELAALFPTDCLPLALAARWRVWLLAGATALLLPLHSTGAQASARKPNIIILLAGDLGYADLGFRGCKEIPTPHLDELATAGVRCSDGYASCPVCAPTRAGILTGRYQQRFGFEFNGGAGKEVGLPLGEKTLPELLRGAGYTTGGIGKWHLGMEPVFHPLKRGFGEFFGFIGGGHSYLPMTIPDKATGRS